MADMNIIIIGAQFQPYAEAAAIRASACYPRLEISVKQGEMRVTGHDPNWSEVRKEILNALYREKIYAETLSMRRSLIEALTAR